MKEPIIIKGVPRTPFWEEHARIFQIPLQNPKMDDDRRTIHEDDREEDRCSIGAFLIKQSGLPLGNHYHDWKTEVFIILSGEGDLITADRNGEHRRERPVGPGDVVVMPPGVAHTFFLIPGSEMLCYSTERFDPSDMKPLKLDREEMPA